MELLKDRPEFKEKIEGNLFLLQDIENLISVDVDYDVNFDDDKDEIITEIVETINKHVVDIKIGQDKVGEQIEDKQILATAIFEILDDYEPEITSSDNRRIAEKIIDKMSQFVKENYGISIKEAYLQSEGIL